MILFVILVIMPLVVCFIYFYLRDSIGLPKKTVPNLPTKIVFERTCDNDYTLGTLALDALTLAGHGRLKAAKYNYESMYCCYANDFNQTIDVYQTFNSNLNEVGMMTCRILREFNKSRRLLSDVTEVSKNYAMVPKIDILSSKIFEMKNNIDTQADTGTAIIQGATVGGLAAVGSWTLVSVLGTASTGTAITTLSGIAAHNSILAWFGGGAIAAGGGGMASGAVTLGAIAVVPLIVISAYQTHSSANELNQKTLKVKGEIPKIISERKELLKINEYVVEQHTILQKHHEKIEEVNKKIHRLIYPNGIFSQFKRGINSFKKQDYYTKQEVEDIEALLLSVNQLYKMFESTNLNMVH